MRQCPEPLWSVFFGNRFDVLPPTFFQDLALAHSPLSSAQFRDAAVRSLLLGGVCAFEVSNRQVINGFTKHSLCDLIVDALFRHHITRSVCFAASSHSWQATSRAEEFPERILDQ
jgi:hypothetical protein